MMKLNKENLNKLHEGKTKDVYQYSDNVVCLHLKADASGAWQNRLITSDYYFNKFNDAGICTHYLNSDSDENLMLLRAGKPLKSGLQGVVRYFARDCLLEKSPDARAEATQELACFEISLEDDAQNFSPLAEAELEKQGIMTKLQYEQARRICCSAARIMQADLQTESLTLVDVKFEVGLIADQLALIGEITADMMRVVKGAVLAENLLTSAQLTQIVITQARRAKLVDVLLANQDNCCI